MLFLILLSCVQVNSDLENPRLLLSEKHLSVLEEINEFLGDIHKRLNNSRRIVKNVDREIRSLKLSAPPAKRVAYQQDSNVIPEIIVLSDHTTGYQPDTTTTMSPTTTKPTTTVFVNRNKYYTDALEKLWYSFGQKKHDDVDAVAGHIDTIFKKAKAKGTLAWLGSTTADAIMFLLPGQSHKGMAMVYYHWLLNRETQLSKLHNEFFDFANKIIEDGDGERLLELVEEFDLYPEGNKTGEELCEKLIEGFALPFEKNRQKQEMRTIMRKLENNFRGVSNYGEFKLYRKSGNFKTNNKDAVYMPIHAMRGIDIFMNELQEKIRESRYVLLGIDKDALTNVASYIQQPSSIRTTKKQPITTTTPHIKTTPTRKKPTLSVRFAKNRNPTKTTHVDATLITTNTNPTFTISFDTTKKTTTRTVTHDDKDSDGTYFSMAYERLLKIIALKNPLDVKEVLQHTKPIVDGMIAKKKLKWLGPVMLRVVKTTANVFSNMDINELQSTAANLHSLMRDRHEEYDKETNQAINYADSLVGWADGQKLLNAIKDFYAYPKVTKNAETVCRNIVEGFEAPFVKLKGTEKLQKLLKTSSAIITESNQGLRSNAGQLNNNPENIPFKWPTRNKVSTISNEYIM